MNPLAKIATIKKLGVPAGVEQFLDDIGQYILLDDEAYPTPAQEAKIDLWLSRAMNKQVKLADRLDIHGEDRVRLEQALETIREIFANNE